MPIIAVMKLFSSFTTFKILFICSSEIIRDEGSKMPSIEKSHNLKLIILESNTNNPTPNIDWIKASITIIIRISMFFNLKNKIL